MMNFTELTEKEFDNVCENFKGSSFYQTTDWAKIKEFTKTEIEMVDADVNVEIDVRPMNVYTEDDANIDIKQLEDDKNSSTGNI